MAKAAQSKLGSTFAQYSSKHSKTHHGDVLCSVEHHMCTSTHYLLSRERSSSALKRIKTPLLLSMGTEQLAGLALLHIHRDIFLNTSDIIDEFAWRHPRKLQLSDIFAD